MKKYLICFFGLSSGIWLAACSDDEKDFPSNNMRVFGYFSHTVEHSFVGDKAYFISFVLNNGTEVQSYFSKENLLSAIADFSNGKRDKVFVNPENEYGIYSLIPEDEQIPMSQREFDNLSEDSPFRAMKYNEKSPYIIQPDRRYSSAIPLRYAEKIKYLIDESIIDKNSNYEFSIEFIPFGISVTLKETNQENPKIFKIDIL